MNATIEEFYRIKPTAVVLSTECSLIDVEMSDIKGALAMNKDQLAQFAAIIGKPISIGIAPLIGKYIQIDNKRVAEHEPAHEDLEFSFQWYASEDEVGKLIRIYIGSKIHGPLMSWDSGYGWRNCYGRGDHRKNGACGGHWSSDGRRVYASISEALDKRDYMVKGLVMHRNRLTEGPALIDALRAMAEQEADLNQ